MTELMKALMIASINAPINPSESITSKGYRDVRGDFKVSER